MYFWGLGRQCGGRRWRNTRMADPQRSERLWLVIAIAQVLVMRQGTIQPDEQDIAPTTASSPPEKSCPEDQAGKPPGTGKRRRSPILSVFLRGLKLLVISTFARSRLARCCTISPAMVSGFATC